jgi:4-diphosphocytidyl-2-C-methyl-D-erythritol kinase
VTVRRAAVSAPAKLNLILRVGVRDSTGYHQLESLFVKLALADDVRVTVGDSTDDRLVVTGPALPLAGLGPEADNLALRALRAYRAATGWPDAAQLAIHKRIPVGGGLGGGSADAAGVLRALDALAPQPIGIARLLALGASLGADVPFLVSDALLAWGWGRGDRLLALPALPPRTVWLVPQEVGVPTASAYGWLAEAGGGSGGGATLYSADALSSWGEIAARAHNDFTAVIRPRHAGVAAALDQLEGMAAALRSAADREAFALMSGSGATCALVTQLADPGSSAGGTGGGEGFLRTSTSAGVVGVIVEA